MSLERRFDKLVDENEHLGSVKLNTDTINGQAYLVIKYGRTKLMWEIEDERDMAYVNLLLSIDCQH